MPPVPRPRLGQLGDVVKRIEPGSWASIGIIYSQGALGAAIVTQGPPLLGDISRAFDVTLSTASLFVSLSAAFPLVGLVLVGWVIDRVGGRRAMMASSAIILLADVWMFFAPSLASLFSARFVESIGRTVCMAGGIGLLASTTSGKRRVYAMAIGATFGPVGLAIGFALGSPFAGTEDWRLSFLAHGVWALLQVVAAAATVMPGRSASGPQNPMRNPFAIYKYIGPLRLALACLAEVFVQHGLSTMLPPYFQSVHGVPAGRTSFYQALSQLANIPGALLTGALLARGARHLRLAWALGVLGIIAATTLLIPSVTLGVAVTALVLINVAFGGLIAFIFTLVPRVAPGPDSHSSTAGLLQQLAAVGGLSGPFVFVLLSTTGGWQLPAAAAGLGLVLMATILPIWPRDMPAPGSGTAREPKESLNV